MDTTAFRDTVILILLMFMTAMLFCLVLIMAYRVGLEMQWQHADAIQSCIAHNLNATDGSHCIV
jgi:hypothetical protein